MLTSAAAAQDGSEPANRTVEGAQHFLEKFYGAYPARGEVNGYQGGTQWAWREAPGFELKMLEGCELEDCRTLQDRGDGRSPAVPQR